MAVVELLFGRKEASKIRKVGSSGSVWDLVFDATLSEQGEFTNRVTSFPVESGSFISDHVIHEPEEVVLEGLISNASINMFGKIAPNVDKGTVIAPERSSDPVLAAYLKLLEFAGYDHSVLQTSAMGVQQNITISKILPLVDILTEFRLYTDMALQKLSVPRKADTGEALIFTVGFKKVRRVNSYVIAAYVSEEPKGAQRARTKAPKKLDAGQKETAPVSAPLESRIFDWTH